MQFNGNSDSSDIVSEVLKICKATTGKYSLKDIARRVNLGIDRYFEIAFEVTGDASFDDSNRAAAPIVTQAFVSGTNSYKLSSFSGSLTNFVSLEALDAAGNQTALIEESSIEINFSQDYSTSITGTPSYFVKIGDFIYVRPTPNYNKNPGLRAFVNRQGSYVASTDTTINIGIPSIHHAFLCKYAAQPYLEEFTMANAQSNFQHILEDEQRIRDFFFRSKRGLTRMQPLRQNNK